MAKLLKMLWEYMDLTVLPFFETWSAHIFGGWQRVCWCTNEAFNQASPTKEFWENCPQKKGGHIYGKNEGWHIYGNYCTTIWYKPDTPGIHAIVAKQVGRGESFWRWNKAGQSPAINEVVKALPTRACHQAIFRGGENSLLGAEILALDRQDLSSGRNC